MEILIRRRALLSALAGAKAAKPNEFICLLTGKKEKGNVIIEDTLIPPGIMVHPTMSSFSDWMMPYITDLLGTFHSHPGGASYPSRQDRWLFSRRGGVHFIAAHFSGEPEKGPLFAKSKKRAEPFGHWNVSAYLGSGEKVAFRVVD